MDSQNERAVVVPLDGSQVSESALGAARALTSIMGGSLHVVHVTEASLREEKLLDHLKVGGEFEYMPHRLSGKPVDAILEFAMNINAKMIVMCSHGETYNSRDIMGSKTRGLAQRSSLPILVIHPGARMLPDTDWKPGRMLVPLDGTPLPVTVVDRIFDLAQGINMEVWVLHIAVPGARRPLETGTYASPRYTDHPYYDWPAWADEFTRRFTSRRPQGVKLRLSHRRGNPIGATIDFAMHNGMDIIALSWHGHMEKRHAATVKGILRKAELPVMLIKI